MSTSLNGWPGIATSGPALRSIKVPGTNRTVVLEATCAPLFAAYLADWHRTVMPIDGDRRYLGPDGWEYRQARTGDGLSNHASGTAVDVRYDVLKADHLRHMTPAQIVKVHALLDKYVDGSGRRVFGWGGDWKVADPQHNITGYCDEMHTELAQSWANGARGRATTKTDVLAVIARLGIHSDGTTLAPYVKPIGWFSTQRAQILLMQKALGVRATGTYLPVVDGGFRAAIAKWQASHPAAFNADGRKAGVIGPNLYASLLTRLP